MLDTSKVEKQLAITRRFADQHGLREQLEEQLRYLDTYGEDDDRGRVRCTLYPDFAPHSFGFRLERRQEDGSYVHWMSGGLIFHGSGGGSGGAPEYSVSLVPQIGWSVHT